jgi:hypothetical protein
MRTFSLALMCGLLLVVAACGSDSTQSDDGEINSQADVQQLFEAIVPDLIAAFTELANQQSSALSLSTDKGGGQTSTVQCPGGGTLVVDLASMLATLTDCSVGGVTISATLFLTVFPTTPMSYQANFSGPLMVTGTFNGTVQVDSAVVQWTDPPSANSTFWDVVVTVNDQLFVASSAGVNSACPTVDLNDFSGPPGAPCDDASDCQANSCRDPAENMNEGCTCRNLDGPICPPVNGNGSLPFGADCDDDGDCAGFPCIDCVCI